MKKLLFVLPLLGLTSCAAALKEAPIVTTDVAALLQCVEAHDTGADPAAIAISIAAACGPAAVSDVTTILNASRTAAAAKAAAAKKAAVKK